MNISIKVIAITLMLASASLAATTKTTVAAKSTGTASKSSTKSTTKSTTTTTTSSSKKSNIASSATSAPQELGACTPGACGQCEVQGASKFCTECNNKPMAGTGVNRRCSGGKVIVGCDRYESDAAGKIYCSSCAS